MSLKPPDEVDGRMKNSYEYKETAKGRSFA